MLQYFFFKFKYIFYARINSELNTAVCGLNTVKNHFRRQKLLSCYRHDFHIRMNDFVKIKKLHLTKKSSILVTNPTNKSYTL